MNPIIRRYGTFLILVMLAFVIGNLIGCADTVTTENSFVSAEIYQEDHRPKEKIDELWIISSRTNSRSDLTLEQIIKIIEANRDQYTNADGESDPDLLRRFVMNTFDQVDIITDPLAISVELNAISVCCVYNPDTNSWEIRIVKK